MANEQGEDWKHWLSRMEQLEADREAKLIAQVDVLNLLRSLKYQNEQMRRTITRVRWVCYQEMDKSPSGKVAMIDAENLMRQIDWRY